MWFTALNPDNDHLATTHLSQVSGYGNDFAGSGVETGVRDGRSRGSGKIQQYHAGGVQTVPHREQDIYTTRPPTYDGADYAR